MSQNFDWTLLSIQPIDCRPLLPISAYSGHFAPDFAPGFAPEIYPKPLGFRPKDTTPSSTGRELPADDFTALENQHVPRCAYEYLRNNKPGAHRRVHAGAGQALEAILISTLFGFKNQHSEVVGSTLRRNIYIYRGYACETSHLSSG
jgi:hypothetical protein